jgi:caffeoyl-CoA O-methyltransferase
MSVQIQVTDKLYDYLLSVSPPEHPVLAELRAETARHPLAMMQISALQGQFMQLVAQLISARRAIEVGVFTGYSSLAVALAMPEEGRIVALDISDEFTTVARRAWAAAGVSHKIDLRLGPALESMDAMIAAGESGAYDLCFIDADKGNYPGYWDRAVTLLRPGGVIMVDNTLYDGLVLPGAADRGVGPLDAANAKAIAAFNLKVKDDPRVRYAITPIGDGLTMAIKR